MNSAAIRSNRRKLLVLAAIVLLCAAGYMLVGVNFSNPKLFAYAMKIRTPKLVVMLITAFSIGGASLVFQSIINNTIVTPCLLGMNSLYTLIHTAVVFFLGSASIVATNANLSFGVDVVLMGITATILYSWIFQKTKHNVLYELVELEVPYDPQRIAILDMASLDILDALGVGDRVVGTADTSLEYLQDYITDDIANLGTIKEADLEAVMACEPDVIFIGGRLASSYDALSEIAPVVYLATDTELGVVESVRQNAATIASLFGLEEKVDELMAGFDARITALQEVSAGQTAIVGMCTSGSFNVLGNDGRCSIIGREVGFENIGVDANIDTSTHGNEASFEFIVDKNPDYIFVMDRDAAIGTDGAQLAQDIMENELVMGTDAYKNGHLIYLAHPAVWYTAEGGITALDIMLQDLESELLH